MTQLHGIDVSDNQGPIDWPAVKRAGITFAAIKATFGLTYRDRLFPANWRGAREAGLVRGAYHFLVAGADGAAQADFLHASVRNHGHFHDGDFILLDLEEQSIAGEPPPVVLAGARDFVRRARARTARPVFLYTNPDTWNNLLGGPHDPLLATCPLWLADYGPPPLSKLTNWPAGPSFWQRSPAGRVPGIRTAVDLDTFFGGPRQLKALTAPLPPAMAKALEDPHP